MSELPEYVVLVTEGQRISLLLRQCQWPKENGKLVNPHRYYEVAKGDLENIELLFKSVTS